MGLYDRNYMRGGGSPYGNGGGSHGNFLDNGRNMIWLLIGINVFCFLLFPSGSPAWRGLVMMPDVLGSLQLYRLITAGFMHGGFMHILFNMWGLYIFGMLVVPHLGSYRFLWLYLSGVLIGNLLFLAFNSNAILLGASGAVCAVMMAAAMLEPSRRFVMMFFPMAPIKTSTLVIVYTVIEIISEIGNLQGGVAHLAHLGGFLGGLLYLKFLYRSEYLPWDPLRFLKGNAQWKRPEWTFRSPSSDSSENGEDGGRVSPRELDALLDKISREGINSLSEYELARLKQARREMRGE